MSVNSHLYPDRLFKFVNVRQAHAAKHTDSPVGVPYYAGVPKARITSMYLFPKLEAKKASTTVQNDIVEEVSKFKKQTSYYGSNDALHTTYPELRKMIDYLDSYGEAITQKGIMNKFMSWAGVSLETYTENEAYNNKKMVVWDNLLAHIISPVKSLPMTLLCKMIGAFNTIDKINTALKSKPATELSSQQVYDAYHIQPLIPEWLVMSLMSKGNSSDNVVNMVDYTAPDKTMELKNKIHISSTIVEELKSIHNEKLNSNLVHQKQKSNEINKVFNQTLSQEELQSKIQAINNKYNKLIIDSDTLTEADECKISANAKKYLFSKYTSLKDLNINALIQDQIVLSQQLMAQLGITLNSPQIYLANTLIDEDGTKCQHYDNKPYCDDGRQATKPFVSGGSFVSAMIIGDLLVTKQQLLKYDTGEVAHIENILAGESKSRTHRQLDRTEVTTTRETETETETLRDTQTTERFSMEKESSKALATEFNINAGVNASADYGTYQINAYMNGGYSSSTQEANKQASKFSKDVSDRTLQRVKTIVREMQTVHILKETEETNVHELKNPIEEPNTFATTPHINGVYKWVDKFYLNRIVNYGRRLMLEFQIPEPANFYIFRGIQNKLNNDSIVKPVAPKDCMVTVERDYQIGLTSSNVLTETNYTFWASYYGATDVEAPPTEHLSFSRSISSIYGDPTNFQPAKTGVFNVDIPIQPEGYKVYGAAILTQSLSTVYGILGNQYFSAGANLLTYDPTHNYEKQIGLALFSQGAFYDIVVTLKLKRTDELFSSWQLKTYGKILDAYERKLSEYNDWLNSQNANSILIEGNNPDINRQTERTELKKRCIEMFSGQRFEANDAAVDGIHNLSGYPEILFNEAIREGNIVKFFEHAFEWENMSYIFYDYFYARKSKWLNLTKLDDKADPLFKKFLQAGNARVNVPIRPGYEKLVMLFHTLSNWISSIGCAWNFDPQIFGQFNLSTEFSPGIENGTYMSIAEELKAAEGLNDFGTFVTDSLTGITTTNIIDAYIQKVPTNLVYLANGAGPYPELPDNSTDTSIAQVMTYFDL